jgi:hypothetical protein
MCKIGEISNFEIRSNYDKLCGNDRLKGENKIVAKKGLTLALKFPKVLSTLKSTPLLEI